MMMNDKLFDIVLIDFPWHFETRTEDGQGKAPSQHYDTQSITIEQTTDIMKEALKMSSKRAVFLWWIYNPLLVKFASIVNDWEKDIGVMYKSVSFMWCKSNRSQDIQSQSFIYPPVQDESFWFKGTGYYTRPSTEQVWLFRRTDFESWERQDMGVGQLVTEPTSRHSRKPMEIYNRLDRLYGSGDDVKRLELFARPPFRDGWTVMGNEVDGLDIFEALKNKQVEMGIHNE